MVLHSVCLKILREVLKKSYQERINIFHSNRTIINYDNVIFLDIAFFF